jgi:hypothetical protein
MESSFQAIPRPARFGVLQGVIEGPCFDLQYESSFSRLENT